MQVKVKRLSDTGKNLLCISRTKERIKFWLWVLWYFFIIGVEIWGIIWVFKNIF